MILKIELENFFSIRDRVCIDFRAGNINTEQSRKLADNVIVWKSIKILKSIGLFGPNASGKTSILKAINFCQMLIRRSQRYGGDDVFRYEPFKFGGHDRPSVFLIDFVLDDTEYEYSFSLLHSEIIAESLYHYPNNRRARIFVRRGNDYRFSEGVLPRPKDVELNTGSKNLFLSQAASMNRELAQKLCRYFSVPWMRWGQESIFPPWRRPGFEKLFDDNKRLIVAALAASDSDIYDIEKYRDIISPEELQIDRTADDIMRRDVSMFRMCKFRTYHRIDGRIPFDLEEESLGTRKLFALLAVLIDAAKNRRSIVLDEFDSSLHANIAEFVLDIVNASSQSQLLFTSHNLSLINADRLRKDQIVFVSKNNKSGATEISSLYDYSDFRGGMNAEKAYRQGRFDAVPVVTLSVKDIKRLFEEE